jgi:hypothetical protein
VKSKGLPIHQQNVIYTGKTTPLIIKAVNIITNSSKTKTIRDAMHQSILMQIDPSHNTILPHANKKVTQT